MKHVRKRASFRDRISSRFATLFYESSVRQPGKLYGFRELSGLRTSTCWSRAPIAFVDAICSIASYAMLSLTALLVIHTDAHKIWGQLAQVTRPTRARTFPMKATCVFAALRTRANRQRL